MRTHDVEVWQLPGVQNDGDGGADVGAGVAGWALISYGEDWRSSDGRMYGVDVGPAKLDRLLG
ncbi:hypothetical protein [Nocardioides plantarum]|uniref:hypothetical protein n=1 Tax=Nocardioides plantarum TaxID=29299 RepID=UPI0036D2C3E0